MAANRNQPFIFRASVGAFLHSVALFFTCIAIGVGLFVEASPGSNELIVGILLNAVVIQFLLVINSRLLYSIFAFITIGAILVQLFWIFGWVFYTDTFNGMTMGQGILITLFISFFIAFFIGIQVFCAAALIKLSGIDYHPEPIPPPPSRPIEESSKSELPSSMTPCSHSPVCSVISVKSSSVRSTTIST